jgi:hypothetical protein
MVRMLNGLDQFANSPPRTLSDQLLPALTAWA